MARALFDFRAAEKKNAILFQIVTPDQKTEPPEPTLSHGHVLGSLCLAFAPLREAQATIRTASPYTRYLNRGP
jgi:hypothetical protein